MNDLTVTGTTAGGWYVAFICEHCGGNHYSQHCPYIREIEYFEDGRVKRVEFYPRPVTLPPPVVTISTGWR